MTSIAESITESLRRTRQMLVQEVERSGSTLMAFGLYCLKYFCLNTCYKVKKLPEELGCFRCLEELNVTSTAISHLPQSICFLKGLRVVGSRSLLESCAFETEIQSSDDGTFSRI
nr:TMV resistance protein N-like [Tanacetum cinerariifolium]